ncbi:nucleotidyltransferase domain-containing protein [archaeon]|nr:nucleotidyltransferase domain-containing protein [archaeon]
MKLELRIIDLLARNTEKSITINEIARSLDEHYSLVYRVVDKLATEGTIIKNRVGKADICSLNPENEKTAALLSMAEIEKREEFYSANKELKLMLKDFLESLDMKFGDSAVVLFGSYAKGTAIKESDVDILLINKGNVNAEKATREIYAKYGKEISAIVITPSDFKKQINSAIIKEIIKNHYVLHGAEYFVKQVPVK